MVTKSRPKPPTQADVARGAGVSRTTVSYVLSNDESVSIPDETRQRVWDVIRALDYTPNRAAQRLRTQKTFTIAGIIEDITNPFHPAFERGIQDVAEQHGYDLIMYNTDADPAKERRALDAALRNRVDGVIGSFSVIDTDDFRPLLAAEIPMVWLTGQPPVRSIAGLDVVYVDNVRAAHTAVSFLAGKGHQRIAMLAGHGHPQHDRLIGYRQALEDHELVLRNEYVQGEQFSIEEGKRAMRVLLALDEPPTAVFAASDLLAVGAMVSIRQAGLRIPDDVAIVGFDNILVAEVVTPALTTIALNQAALGHRCGELLFERIRGEAPEDGRAIEMPFELIVRETA
jgi:LacI family transcriptional regulator